MLIKEYLEKSKSHLLYPESYSSKQMKATVRILEIFENMDIDIQGEQALEVRLEDKNTVIIMPIRNSEIIEFLNFPEMHKKQDNTNGWTIEPKRKFRKQFPQTLIIRRNYFSLQASR